MKTIQSVLGVAAMMLSATVFAQLAPLPGQWTPPEPTVEEPVVEEPVAETPAQEPAPTFSGPTAGAAAKLYENMQKLPDNPGLPKALARVQIERATQRVERPERVERVERSPRAEIARANRPERPQGNGRR